MLGWETLQRILSTFFERWKFRHPRPEDFFAVANEVSGQDLTSFFDHVHRSSNVFDYAVERLTSVRPTVRGMSGRTVDPVFQERTVNTLYRTTVVVRRHGEAFFPVEVVTTFDDGSTARERWDGRDRWRMYTYQRPGRAVQAQVDPERTLLLDVNYTNNSRTLSPQGDEAATKWSLKWLVWLQDLLLTWGFFV